MSKSFRLQRRTFLRGAGVAIGLPVLEAMLDGRGLLLGAAHAQAAQHPTRLVTMFFSNGTYLPNWVPDAQGAGYALKPGLAPIGKFAGLQAQVNVISGLSNTGFDNGVGGGHCRGTSTFGVGVANTSSGAGGPSIDQVAAQKLGSATRYSSLVLSGSDPQSSATDGCGSANMNMTSWAGRNTGVPCERDSRAIFNKLFSGFTPPSSGAPAPSGPALATLERKSVLDFVKSDIDRLNPRLGASDRARLEQHLTVVRELERQLPSATTPTPPPPTSCAVPAQPASSTNIVERTKVNLQLLALALACDLTRFAHFQIVPGAGNYKALTFLGLSDHDHNISHTNDWAAITKVTAWKVEQFAYFCSLLQATPEGTGTLLDHSVVYLGSEVAEGHVHSKTNMPILVAGRGNGRVTPGRHLRFSGSVNNLHAALLTIVGVPTTKFGADGSAPLNLA